MGRIKLVYWQVNISNYGDLLSPYIVGKLSGFKIIHKNYACGNWKSHLFHFVRSMLRGDFSLKTPYLFPFEKHVLAIGSILSYTHSSSNVWGSGFMGVEEPFHGGKIYAVRGKLSLAHLQEEERKSGFSITNTVKVSIGDPALLLPLIYNPSVEKIHKIGIIPHYSEYRYFEENFSDKFHVVKLQGEDVEEITRDILSCEYIFSTSLHGIIVAHAYGIPALWIEYTGLEKGTNGFKFLDYFSSVKIPSYKPIREIDSLLKDNESIKKVQEKYEEVSLPKGDINEVQRNLLNCAPFNLKKQFKF